METLRTDTSETFIPAATGLTDVKRRLLQSYINGGTSLPPSALSIMAEPCSQPAPLSLSQEQLLLREINNPGIPPLYNECIDVRMRGHLDVGALERSFAEIIRRHEIWRTSYQIQDARPVQIVHNPPESIRVPVINIEAMSKEKRENAIQEIISALVQRPFDLTNGPLLRATLIRLSEFEHHLYLAAHLSIVDGISVYQVFPHELASLYSSYCSGEPSTCHDLPIQFGDYTRWQRRWYQGKEVGQQLEYWATQLAGDLPVLNWPKDRTRPPKETFRGEIQRFVVPESAAQ